MLIEERAGFRVLPIAPLRARSGMSDCRFYFLRQLHGWPASWVARVAISPQTINGRDTACRSESAGLWDSRIESRHCALG